MIEILVIDDNKDFRLIYKRKLCRMSADYCSSIEEAKKCISNKKYDLLLISETVMSKGKKDIESIIKELEYKVPVVILVTGRRDRESLKEYNNHIIVNKCTNSEDFSKLLNKALLPKKKYKKLEMQLDTNEAN